jgi:hypothetical protein
MFKEEGYFFWRAASLFWSLESFTGIFVQQKCFPFMVLKNSESLFGSGFSKTRIRTLEKDIRSFWHKLGEIFTVTVTTH